MRTFNKKNIFGWSICILFSATIIYFNTETTGIKAAVPSKNIQSETSTATPSTVDTTLSSSVVEKSIGTSIPQEVVPDLSSSTSESSVEQVKIETTKQKVAKGSEKQPETVQTVSVKPNQTLWEIAKEQKMSFKKLLDDNFLTSTFVEDGQTLIIKK